jgi:hypothetical protein
VADIGIGGLGEGSIVAAGGVPVADARATLKRPREEPMINDDASMMVRRLATLRTEHRDLDETIARWVLEPGTDELELKRMKKRKLQLKDSINLLESRLIPDLDA